MTAASIASLAVPPWKPSTGDCELSPMNSQIAFMFCELQKLNFLQVYLSTEPVSQKIISNALSLPAVRYILIKSSQVYLPCGITWSLAYKIMLMNMELLLKQYPGPVSSVRSS